MRLVLDVRSLAVGVFAGAALFASFGAGQGERPEGRRFLDALSPGDRIDLGHRFGPPSSECEGLRVEVLMEAEADERSMTPEEAAELSNLNDRSSRNELDPDGFERMRQLAAKAERHPAEVLEVGGDSLTYRTWAGWIVSVPERQIRSISRRAADGKAWAAPGAGGG